MKIEKYVLMCGGRFLDFRAGVLSNSWIQRPSFEGSTLFDSSEDVYLLAQRTAPPTGSYLARVTIDVEEDW